MPIAGLAPPADSRTALKEYEHIFEDTWTSRTRPDAELYSPVYDGRTDPRDDPFPFAKKEHLRLLLQMMQTVVNIWLRQTVTPLQQQATEEVVLNSLCQRIKSMPSSNLPKLPTTDHHIYEACRLTSVLMIRSVESGRMWRSVAEGTSLLGDIREALQKTDLDSLWDKQIGLLYWVILVFHCAAFGTPDYPFGHTLETRIHFELTYTYGDWHGALKPMLVLNDVMPSQ